MIAANNYFTQQHNRHLKIHSKQQQQIHHNVNKFVVKTSTDSPQKKFSTQGHKQRNSSFDLRSSVINQQDINQSAIYSARSVTQDKQKQKNTRIKMVRQLLNSSKKRTIIKQQEDSSSNRVNYHNPFKKPLKNIKRDLESLKKVSQLVPNNTPASAKKYFSQTPRKKPTMSVKTNGEQYESQMKRLQKYHQHSFEDYMDFISAKNKSYLISLSFENLRKLTRAEAWKLIDIKNVKLIQSIMLCIFDNISNQRQNSKQVIKQYCMIYFNNFEKSKLQVILTHHYFKMLAVKLKSIFIYQRMVMYFIFMLTKMDLLFQNVYAQPIQKSLKAVQQTYTTLLLVVIEVQKSKDSKVSQTFQILKSVSQIQKKLSQIELQFKAIPVQSLKSLGQVKKQMKPFLSETQNHIKSQQHLTKMQMILSWKYLKVPPTPFLPGLESQFKYTLVVDLDQTLIYFNQENNILKYRPFMDTFLNSVKQYYQLIMFTASSKEYADVIIKEIQNAKSFFSYRLYRQHLTLFNGRMIKDISRIGRDMRKTIIIDNLKVNFCNNPENGIEISTWNGNKKDRNLLQLLPKLLEIIQDNVVDVRQYLITQKKTLSHIAQDLQEQQN